MKKNLEKTLATLSPVIMLVGKTAGKLKDSILTNDPTAKIIEVNSNNERIEEERNIMRKDMVKQAVKISIPIMATCVGLLVNKINKENQKKKINDDLNNIDDIDKLEPVKSDHIAIVDEMILRIYDIIESQVTLHDNEAFKVVIKELISNWNYDKLIDYLVNMTDERERKELILKINHTIVFVCNEFGENNYVECFMTKDIYNSIDRLVTHKDLIHLISNILYSKCSSDSNYNTKQLSDAVLSLLDTQDTHSLLKYFEYKSVEPSVQIDVLFKIHDHLESKAKLLGINRSVI